MQTGYNAIGSVWAQSASLSLADCPVLPGSVSLSIRFDHGLRCGMCAYTYAWQGSDSTWQGNLVQLEPLKVIGLCGPLMLVLPDITRNQP